jgi:DNA gyrase subunit A
MNIERDLKEVIEESFTQYSGAVLQSRALVDVRDCLKPSARQIFYCLYTDKFLPNKPFKKTLKAIGSVARVYIHGDASAKGVLMRSSQNFAMRYPLVEVEGNNGNLMLSGNWAAERYTASRLSNFSVKLFEDIEKETIKEWRDNYDDTEQYPMVLPSKGFYNIVNGTQGIGIGMGSSIPQFNITDINKALETLLLNPNATFEEIYCPPDFATGGYLINESEVKEALKYGSKANAKMNNADGASCKLRSKIDFNEKENCLIVTEIPYGVYTNTICEQLEAILEDDEINPGIDRFNDLTGVNPNIKIYLKKGINPDRVIKFLYKNTSLQYHFSINMTMLDQGRFPKVFTWKEALQAHIDHEKEVYISGFKYDLDKIKKRIHIIDGLLICLASIEEVIQEIKSSNSTAEASNKLQSKFLLDEAQAKAVLDMKLSRLAHLEVKKLEDEKAELEIKAKEIEAILNSEELLDNEIIKGWREVTKKYGDEHRTKIIEVVENPEDKEIETVIAEDVVVILSQNGEIKRISASNFKVQRRNGKGVKTEESAILESISTNTIDTLMFFTNTGKMYKMLVDEVPTGTNTSKGIRVSTLINLADDEYVVAMTSLHRKSKPKYVVFFTKKGLIKKSNLEEYMKIKRGKGTAAIKFKDDDSLANVIFMDNEEVVVVTKNGLSIHFGTDDIAAIGRVTSGVRAIKLADDDEVVIGLPIHKNTDNLAIFTSKGMGKKTSLDELPYQGRGGKGILIYKPSASTGEVVGATMIDNEDSVLLVGKPGSICISSKDIPLLSRASQGNIMLKGTVNSVVKL